MFSLHTLKKVGFLLVIAQALIVASAQAATITVNHASDISGNDMVCTLREAIDSIHALTTISTGCTKTGLFGIDDTIEFHPSLSNQTIRLDQGLSLTITKDLIINGLGADQLTIDGASNRPKGIFYITGSPGYSDVSINGLKLSSGESNFGGGGIHFDNVSLHLTDCIVTGNLAGAGGGIYSPDESRLRLTNTTVSANSAIAEGGGIYVSNDTSVILEFSRISDNSAGTQGGGIYVTHDTSVILEFSRISDNSAGTQGGGIYGRLESSVNVISSTVSNNSAGTDGGGVYLLESELSVLRSIVSRNTAQGLGGGIMSQLSDVEIIISTISYNTAINSAGGILFVSNNPESPIAIRQSTITKNFAFGDGGGVALIGDGARATFANSIVSGNRAGDSGGELAKFGGEFISNGFNLFGDSGNTNALAFSNSDLDLSGTDIVATSDGTMPTALASILDVALNDNGGPTKTHALVVGSPAIDKGNQNYSLCSSPDQRGMERSDGKCDIGSYELVSLIFSNGFE